MKGLRFPKLAYNAVTLAGALIAVITGMIMVFMILLEVTTGQSHPYLGIFVYMALPPVVLLGLILIPVGMIRMKRRVERGGGGPVPQWPRIDLNIKPHRNAFFVFVFGTIVFALVGVVGGYQAYHFTESVTFCGQVCHGVMKPEYTAYQNSPHARVPCTACHVGPGANWYVKSKLSGAYQVYAVLFDKYPTPISTPIKNLRPAQETCEQCHWPEKFYGAQQR
ncbi:MAG: NapC/NirT family cytochrome c, partial [bacterium]